MLYFEYIAIKGENIMITFRPPEDMEKELNRLSKETHRPKSYYLREALGEYLEKQREIQKAVSLYEEHLKSGNKGVFWEDVQKKAGLLKDD